MPDGISFMSLRKGMTDVHQTDYTILKKMLFVEILTCVNTVQLTCGQIFLCR